jgi:murein DD-endopeptidase MepM/ murein hydrolase activator NlpD
MPLQGTQEGLTGSGIGLVLRTPGGEAVIHAKLPFDLSLGLVGVTQGVGGTFSHAGVLHYSWDFDVPFGTQVLAIADGWVVDYFDSAATGEAGPGGAGNLVTVRHSGGYSSVFHLAPGSIPQWVKDAVDAGAEARVFQGQVLGTVGDTGRLTGPHIHLTVGAGTITWGASTGHSEIVANGSAGANASVPVGFLESPFILPRVGDELISTNQLITSLSPLVERADEVRIGSFLATAVYGDSAIDAFYRGAADDNGIDDDYHRYLQRSGWDVLTAADLGVHFQSEHYLGYFVRPGWDGDVSAKGEFTSGGLYQGRLLEGFFSNEPWDAQGLLAAGRLPDGARTLALAFRGTDKDDQAVSEGQAWTGNGQFRHYEMFRPLIEAALNYIAANNAVHPPGSAERFEKLVVSGHSLGGVMADVFTAIDAERARSLGIEVTIVSLASAGLDPDLFTDPPGGFTYGGSGRVDTSVVTVSGDSISLTAPAGYIGFAHSEDRVTYPQTDRTGIDDLTPVDWLLYNVNFENAIRDVDLPNISNADVSYDRWFWQFDRGFGAEHNGEFYWHNVNAILTDPLIRLYEGHRLVAGVSDYRQSQSLSGDSLPLFLAYTGYGTWGFDSDRGTRALHGSVQRDYLLGLTGNDEIFGHEGSDLVSGGGGNDTAYAGSGYDTVHGGDGHDDLRGDEHADSLMGARGADTLFGGTGNDTLSGGSESDLLKGEEDHDSLDGGSGSDTLHGDGGNDRLFGGTGRDHLLGGSGADVFILTSADNEVDVIRDFNQGSGSYVPGEGDAIDISALVGTAFAAGQAASALWKFERTSPTSYLRLFVDIDGSGTA